MNLHVHKHMQNLFMYSVQCRQKKRNRTKNIELYIAQLKWRLHTNCLVYISLTWCMYLYEYGKCVIAICSSYVIILTRTHFAFHIDTIVSLTRMLFEYANVHKRYMSDSMKWSKCISGYITVRLLDNTAIRFPKKKSMINYT